jgi:hypothetical protein
MLAPASAISLITSIAQTRPQNYEERRAKPRVQRLGIDGALVESVSDAQIPVVKRAHSRALRCFRMPNESLMFQQVELSASENGSLSAFGALQSPATNPSGPGLSGFGQW